MQEQFGNIKVFVLKSPHQWTPVELQYKSHYINESTAGADASVEVSKLHNIKLLLAIIAQTHTQTHYRITIQHITYPIIIPDIDVTVFLLQVASHHFNVSCLTATFCQ